MITFNEIVDSFEKNPRDVITNPITKKQGSWFHVYVVNRKIFVEPAHEEVPKCSISKPRQLFENEFDDILAIYYKRKTGAQVSAEATQITENKAYWYGIFNDLGL